MFTSIMSTCKNSRNANNALNNMELHKDNLLDLVISKIKDNNLSKICAYSKAPEKTLTK